MSLASIIDKYQASGLFTHVFASTGKLGEVHPYAVASRPGDGRDLFDLASLTKALVTTPLVLRSLGKHQLDIEATLAKWLNAHPGALLHDLHPWLLALPVRRLLGHDSGLPAWRNFWMCHLGSQMPALDKKALILALNRSVDAAIRQDAKQVYSDVGFILLGLVLAQVEDQDLATNFREFCSRELGLPTDLALLFRPGPEWQVRAISTGYCQIRQRVLLAEVHDENSAALGGVSGHAGLFGTGPALTEYLSALVHSSVGTQLLKLNAAARVLPVGTPPNEGLIGWRQGADASSRPYGDGAAIGHLGFTGVAFWVWPEKMEYAILLTNRVVSGRTRPGIAAMRGEVFAELATLSP